MRKENQSMEARLTHAIVLMAAALSLGAGYRTENFIVEAPTKELAVEIGRNAERFRRELALQWIGDVMPTWGQPCMLTAQVGPELGAGGATSFVFDRGEVFGWQMDIQGSRERILDSVLPHEVTHTIFASHFRQALPRWADEGACTTVEHSSERMKQQQMLISFLKTGRGISFSRMFAMKEYPADVMPLYSQGYSLARFLIERRGRRTYMEFLAQGLKDERWEQALKDHYEVENLLALQNTWLDWVKLGSPRLKMESASENVLVSVEVPQPPSEETIYRGQSPDEATVPAARLVPVSPQTPSASGRSAYAEGSHAVLVESEAATSQVAPVAAEDWHPAGTRGLREQQPIALEAATLASHNLPSTEMAPMRQAPDQQATAEPAPPARLMAGQYAISPPFSSMAHQRGQRAANQEYAAASSSDIRRKPIRDTGSEGQILRR
jgi:hypothetical protein